MALRRAHRPPQRVRRRLGGGVFGTPLRGVAPRRDAPRRTPTSPRSCWWWGRRSRCTIRAGRTPCSSPETGRHRAARLGVPPTRKRATLALARGRDSSSASIPAPVPALGEDSAPDALFGSARTPHNNDAENSELDVLDFDEAWRALLRGAQQVIRPVKPSALRDALAPPTPSSPGGAKRRRRHGGATRSGSFRNESSLEQSGRGRSLVAARAPLRGGRQQRAQRAPARVAARGGAAARDGGGDGAAARDALGDRGASGGGDG